MKERKFLHKGFSSEGENLENNGFEELADNKFGSEFLAEDIESIQEDDFEKEEAKKIVTDCTILWYNGQYQKPNIVITDRKFKFSSRHRNVQKIQLRSVSGGGIRYYNRLGTYRIPNGEYVLSLWGSTYGYRYIKACVKYTE